MQSRLETARTILREQSLDAVLISSYPNILYATDYSGFCPDERDAYVLISKKAAYIFTSVLYSEAMPTAVPHLSLININRDTPLSIQLETLCKKHNIKKLGFEEDNLSVTEYLMINALSLEMIPTDFHTLRLHKQPKEIQNIKNACNLTDKAFSFILKKIKPGITEKEIASQLNTFMIQEKAESAFRPIVAFGKNSSIPHHLAGNTKLKKDDVILLDFGAKVDNYVADVTRTFFIGNVSDKWKEIYSIVLDTQRYVQKEIMLKLAGNLPIISSELDTIARNFIIEKDYPAFPYSLGHGIGLQVHERPLLNARYNDVMTNDMVFTLEPGIHVVGEIGIRIEDDFAIQNNKLIRLTHSDNELLVLK